MSIGEDMIWAGSEENRELALAAEVGLQAKHGGENQDEGEPCRLLGVSEGLATIQIKGPLVNSDSPFLEMFGVTGYPEVRDALIEAAGNPEVRQILLDIDSGGGQVSGVADTAKLIRMINDKVKPVTAYAETMASAAYWLGSAAGEVYASKSSMVGSIGVIATFSEYSKANEMEGRTVTVVRAGKHKALANANEPLTEAARAQIQSMVDSAYSVFIDHVAEMRGVTYEVADKVLGDGQEFFGKASLKVGLVDGITSYDALVSDLQQKIVAPSKKSRDNRCKDNSTLSGSTSTEISGGTMAKKALTEADIAALAAGVPIQASSTPIPVVAEETLVIEGVQDGVQTKKGRREEEVIPAPTVDAKAEQSSVAPEFATLQATVQLLSQQLAAKEALLLEAAVKANRLDEQLVEAKAVAGPMLDIVAQSLSNMRVAMGGSTFSLNGTSAAQVCIIRGLG